MKKISVLALICTIVVITAFGMTVFTGCGGGGGSSSCAAPALDASGTWCISITKIDSNCGNTDTTPYNAVFTQSGNTLSGSANGGTYSGTICGSTASVSGSNFGFATTTTFAFSDASHGSGSTSYSNGSCNGTDTFTAVKGACP